MIRHSTLFLTCLALLAAPDLAHAAAPGPIADRLWPPQLDAGSLALFGAGLVVLAVGRHFHRR